MESSRAPIEDPVEPVEEMSRESPALEPVGPLSAATDVDPVPVSGETVDPATEEVATSATLPEPSERPVEEAAPAWMMTFGDLMRLLLTFFILLFSMSSIETEKFRAAANSLQEAFGTLDGDGLQHDVPPPMSDSIPVLSPGDRIVDDVLEEIRRVLQSFVTDNDLQDAVAVAKEAEGVFLRVKSQALFLSGSAGIEPEGASILESLGDITRLIDVPVSVTGHTDDTPISGGSGGFHSNWELSAARAAGVARALVERGQDATLVTVESYGEHRPIVANDTPEGRAQNRRVELYYSRQGVMSTLIERGVLPDPNALTTPVEVAPEREGDIAANG